MWHRAGFRTFSSSTHWRYAQMHNDLTNMQALVSRRQAEARADATRFRLARQTNASGSSRPAKVRAVSTARPATRAGFISGFRSALHLARA